MINGILCGTNICLRQRRAEDIRDIFQWVNQCEWQYHNDPSTILQSVSWEQFLAQGDSRFLIGPDSDANSMGWEIEELLHQEHIGYIKATLKNSGEKQYEIGLCIPSQDQWGKGYGREAVTLLLKYLFLEKKATMIELTTWEGNLRALKLYRHLRFQESLNGRIWNEKEKRHQKTFLFKLSYENFLTNIHDY